MKAPNRPLRLLQFNTNFKQGGIQRHILDLTKFLREKGHHVTLAGAPNVWGSSEIDPDFVEIPLDQVSAADSSTVTRLKAAYKCSKILRSVLQSERIDLIHSHETAPAIVARLALRNSKLPTAITYHGSSSDRTQQFARISRLCANHVISPSQSTLNDLIRFGVPQQRTRVLGLGIQEKPMPSPEKVSLIRKQLSVGDDDVLCFSLSRLDYQKGIDIMIEVAKSVLAQQPNVFFAVGGTGPMADEVASWVANSGISDRFKLLGPISDVENYLSASDIFLLTSRWEALPISIVEAFRAALPVIATDCGGVAELVQDGVGRLCSVGDEEALSNAIVELARNSELRQDLAQEALAQSKGKRFDPETVHLAFERFYQEAIL